MSESWFEENLDLQSRHIETLFKGGRRANLEQVRGQAKGIVRANRPRWRQLPPSPDRPAADVQSTFYQVRLGFQFDVTGSARKPRAHFVYARCSAYLWPAAAGEPLPTVYDLYPRDLYEGEPAKVSIKFGPELKVNTIGGSLGEVSTDVTVGVVEPAIVGWPGEDERAPYWDLRPGSQRLLGVRHLWLLLEAPPGCSGVRLAVMAEGDVRTHFGNVPIGPTERAWDKRPSVVIQ